MPKPITLPDAADLGPQDTLDEAQHQAIADIKDKAWDLPDEPEEGAKKKEDDPPEDKEEDEEKPKKDDDEKNLTPEEEAAQKKEEEAEAKESERITKKAEKLEKTVDEVKELETREKAEEARIAEVAKEEGITVEEVIENEKKDLSVAERHSKDPVKIARALRKEQSEYGKIKAEAEELREYKAQAEVRAQQFREEAFNDEMEKHRDDVIDKYREKYPDKSEDVSDDAIFERGKALVLKGIEAKQAESQETLKTQAVDARAELVKALPEEFKEFLPEIKELVGECDDRQVMSKGFDINYVANYVRGKKYTPEYIKSLKETEYRRGVEQPQIIPKVGGPKPGVTKKSSLVSKATQADKDRAEDMYGKYGWTKDKMIETYMRDDKDNDF